MAAPNDPNDPNKPSTPDAPAEEKKDAEVVPIEEARKRADERAAKDPVEVASPAANAVLQPVMMAVLKELAGLAGADGQIKLGGEDAAARAKTAAVLKGIGAGLGAALAEAFGKWAEKITTPPAATPEKPADPPKPTDEPTDPTKKN